MGTEGLTMLTCLSSSESVGFTPYRAHTDTGAIAFSTPRHLLPLPKSQGWAEQCVKQVRALSHLSPNWDSYGARRVGLRAIEDAIELIETISRFDRVAPPTVGATPNGNVALSWEFGDAGVDVEIDDAGGARFSFVSDADPASDSEGRLSDLTDLIPLLSR